MAELIRTNRECKDCSKVHMHQEKKNIKNRSQKSESEVFTRSKSILVME